MRIQALPLECQSRVCADNVGLIPKYLKPFHPIRGDNGKQIYVCNYCQVWDFNTTSYNLNLSKVFRLWLFEKFKFKVLLKLFSMTSLISHLKIKGEFRGHNSIVYHTRRHIGDYPYRCGTCGYAEVSKVSFIAGYFRIWFVHQIMSISALIIS